MSTPTLIRCIGCGLPLGSAGEAPSQGALDHVRTCEKHPLWKEHRALRVALGRHAFLSGGRCIACPGTRQRHDDRCWLGTLLEGVPGPALDAAIMAVLGE